MPNPLDIYILNIYDLVWFGLVWFHEISTIAGYLIPNPLYTYILDLYDLVCSWCILQPQEPGPRTISVRSEYLKTFNSVQTNEL